MVPEGELAVRVMPPWAPGYGPDSIMGQTAAGLVLEAPAHTGAPPTAPDGGWSWVYLVLALVFFAVAMRIKGSSRFIAAMVNDLTDTRERQNVFDDTVKETSFLILVNLLWVVSSGVLLAASFRLLPDTAGGSFTPPAFSPEVIGVCTLAALAYDVVMLLAYWVVGNVFTDSRKTESWVRGAAAASGLQTILLFPLACLVMAQPQWTATLLFIALATFPIGKIIFIFKGFRILFTKTASGLLFLYYLCSLEIVPLLLIYVLTLQICTSWL